MPIAVIAAGEADAEGDDQDEPVADAVERDRREQDDERGRARDDPAGDADPEQAPRLSAWSCVVVVPVAVAVPVAVVVVGAARRPSATRARASGGR